VATHRFISIKKLFFLSVIQLFSCTIFAQSGTLPPDGFIVPNLASDPTCTVADKGKMYYNTTTNLMMVCNGTGWALTT